MGKTAEQLRQELQAERGLLRAANEALASEKVERERERGEMVTAAEREAQVREHERERERERLLALDKPFRLCVNKDSFIHSLKAKSL